MATDTGVTAGECVALLTHYRERSTAFSWHAGVISGVEEQPTGYLRMEVTILSADGERQTFQHVPPRQILEGLVRYYRLRHRVDAVDAAACQELVGHACWLLVKCGTAYKIFGSRELEDRSH